ncbi:hypothetical protein ABZY31_08555 [Streptomyces sp. NPDC006529]|uniref:hypothetical protein n=1 Tax=Streptomyces sp. NPDC006529 TaxID=3157177 RepID=UPI0033B330DD
MGHKTTRGIDTREPTGGPQAPPETKKPETKKLDLSAAQVAGSSLATVAAALLASKLGVYGTILGAGVVSVVATAGGPVIGHFFRRTGDQLRETARPRARQVPVVHGNGAGGATTGVPPLAAPTTAFPTAGAAAVPDEEFGRASTHGTRVRGWKRTAVAAGAAFAIALGGIAGYEALSGGSVGERPLYTAVTGGSGSADRKPDPAPTADDRHGAGDRPREEGPGTGSSTSPSRSPGGQDPSPGPDPSRSTGPTPSPDPSRSTGPTPTPAPSRPTPAPTPVKPTPPAGQGGPSPS